MTGAMIAIVVVIWAALVNAVRMGDDYPLPQVLPFCGGMPVGTYDVAGCVVLLAFVSLSWSMATAARVEKDDATPRFRQSLWLVPLSLVVADYVRRNVKPSIQWRGLLDQFNVSDPERFSQLAVLIATCAAILAIEYVWKKR